MAVIALEADTPLGVIHIETDGATQKEIEKKVKSLMQRDRPAQKLNWKVLWVVGNLRRRKKKNDEGGV